MGLGACECHKHFDAGMFSEILLQKGGDLAQERVANDFVGLQVNDGDAGGFAGEAIEEVGKAVVGAGKMRVVDLREVAHDDHFGAVAETSDERASLVRRDILEFIVDDETFGEAAPAHFDQRNELDVFADELFHFPFGGGRSLRGGGDFLGNFDYLVEVVDEAESLVAGFLGGVARKSADVVAET